MLTGGVFAVGAGALKLGSLCGRFWNTGGIGGASIRGWYIRGGGRLSRNAAMIALQAVLRAQTTDAAVESKGGGRILRPLRWRGMLGSADERDDRFGSPFLIR